MIDLWEPGGTYAFPPLTGIQMQIVSTNAQDSAAGTGVRTVHFHYLDVNFREQLQIITLNGITPVLTAATNIIRVNKFHSLTNGTFGAGAAGTISVQSVGGAITYHQMNTPFNVGLQTIYTVPVTSYYGIPITNFFITGFNCSSGSTGTTRYTRFFLRTTSDQFEPDKGTYQAGVFLIQSVVGTLNSTENINFKVPVKVTPKTDIKVSAISDSATPVSLGTCYFQGYFCKYRRY